jgi:hypothetical protein
VTEQSPCKHSVMVQGVDAGASSYWSWEWDDGTPPQFQLIARADVDAVLADLSCALPGLIAEEIEQSEEGLRLLSHGTRLFLPFASALRAPPMYSNSASTP